MAPNGIQHRGGEGLRPSTASCPRLRAQLANNPPNVPRTVPFLPKVEHNAQLTAGETEARPAQAICSMPGRGVQIQGSCPALCRLQPARASCGQQQSQKQPLFCREESTEASPKAKLFGDSSPARGDASGGSTAVREGCSDLKPLTKLSRGRHAPSLCCELAFGCLISACPASCSGLPKKKNGATSTKSIFQLQIHTEPRTNSQPMGDFLLGVFQQELSSHRERGFLQELCFAEIFCSPSLMRTRQRRLQGTERRRCSLAGAVVHGVRLTSCVWSGAELLSLNSAVL